MQSKPWTGVLSTGGRLLFGGTGGGLARDDEAMEAYFYALDAENGKELWRISLGGTMAANPITYYHLRRKWPVHLYSAIGRRTDRKENL